LSSSNCNLFYDLRYGYKLKRKVINDVLNSMFVCHLRVSVSAILFLRGGWFYISLTWLFFLFVVYHLVAQRVETVVNKKIIAESVITNSINSINSINSGKDPRFFYWKKIRGSLGRVSRNWKEGQSSRNAFFGYRNKSQGSR
jgi:hypothetical protein